MKIKREIVKKFNISPKDPKNIHRHQFVRVVVNFKATWCIEREKPQGRKKSTTDENQTKLKDHMEENHTDSIRSVGCKLTFTKSSTQRMLWNNFKMELYKFHCRLRSFSRTKSRSAWSVGGVNVCGLLIAQNWTQSTIDSEVKALAESRIMVDEFHATFEWVAIQTFVSSILRRMKLCV